MITEVNPKLPMRNREVTEKFYVDLLGFELVGNTDYADYLMISKDQVQIHFFEFKALDPLENYAQIYLRTDAIEQLYSQYKALGIIHPNGHLSLKPWGQQEFAILDPDHTLLTFGQDLTIRK